jgi:hypothetical protein
MTVWSILWPCGIFIGHFVKFFPFWYVAPREIWQPCVQKPRWQFLKGGKFRA